MFFCSNLHSACQQHMTWILTFPCTRSRTRSETCWHKMAKQLISHCPWLYDSPPPHLPACPSPKQATFFSQAQSVCYSVVWGIQAASVSSLYALTKRPLSDPSCRWGKHDVLLPIPFTGDVFRAAGAAAFIQAGRTLVLRGVRRSGPSDLQEERESAPTCTHTHR